MATEKKLKDPAEAALSAIEQALNLDHPAGGQEPRSSEARALDGTIEGSRVEPRLPDVHDSDPLATAAGREPAFDGSALPGPRDGRRDGGLLPPDRSLVANDDRRSVGALQQTLRVEPSRAPYAVASLAALLWLSGFAALAWAQSGGDLRGFAAGLTGLQGAVGAAAVLAPVMLFYIAAMLAVRAQEMRLVARAVGEVAIRLAEPEGFSTDAVLTMSQAVRREVAAVGDGVERALARAGELETLVRGEISTLERAYSDNEIRIRTLVDELVAQRESIVANAERVRGAIQGSHQNLTQELDTAAERIVTAVDGAGERVTHALGARGEAITAALGDRGDAVTAALAAAASGWSRPWPAAATTSSSASSPPARA